MNKKDSMISGNTTNSTTTNSNNATKTVGNISTGMNNLWLKLYVFHSDIFPKPETVGVWAGMVLEETVAMFRSEKQKVFKWPAP
jgi:hypothetical protein